MSKSALFVFNGDPMCFIQVLLNALNLHERGTETSIVIEGAATKRIPQLAETSNPLHQLWGGPPAPGSWPARARHAPVKWKQPMPPLGKV